MGQVLQSQKLAQDIQEIKKDLQYIKEHMVDMDMILTPEEEARLQESLDEYRKGNSLTLEEFEKLHN